MRSYTGIVQKGTKRAAALGFPTVNIALPDADVSGVYAARVAVDGRDFLAVAFADKKRKVLEAHVFDFSGLLYGKEITVTLCEKIREDTRFEGDAALRAAIADDVAKVRDHFRAKTG